MNIIPPGPKTRAGHIASLALLAVVVPGIPVAFLMAGNTWMGDHSHFLVPSVIWALLTVVSFVFMCFRFPYRERSTG